MEETPKKFLPALSITLAVATSLTALISHPAAATNSKSFAHPKQMFVAPTKFQRRFDSDYDDYQSYPITGHQATEPSADGTPPQADETPPSPYSTGKIPPSSITGKAGMKPATVAGAKGLGTRNKTFVDSSKFSEARRGTAGAGSPHNTPAVATFVSQAQLKSHALVKSGKLGAAEDMLQADLKAMPNNPTLQNELADVQVARAKYYLKNQNAPLAAQEARSALHLAPNNLEAQTLVGQITASTTSFNGSAAEHVKSAQNLASQSKLLEAKAEFDSAISIQPTAVAYVGLGDIAVQQNDKNLAREQYAKALQLDSESSIALRQRGIFKLQQDSDTVGANQDLSRALILNPSDQLAAQALQQLWRDQIGKNPTNANAHLGLARAFQLSNDLKSAQAEYREVVRLDPQHPNLPAARNSFKLALAKQESTRCLQAAHTLENEGALVDAHAKILEAVNLTPTSISTRLYQGSISEKLGLLKEAHDAYMTILKEDPHNQIAAHHLHNLNSKMGSTASGAADLAAINAATSASQMVANAPNYPSSTTSTGATATPKPQGMYVFRGWQKGSPFVGGNQTQSTTDLSAAAGSTAIAAASNINPNIQPVDASTAGSGDFNNPTDIMPLQGPSTMSPTTSHVNAFSSFLGSLRDINVQNQQNAGAAEDVMRSAINPNGYSSGSGSSSSSSSSTSSGTSGSGTNSNGGSAYGTASDLNNLLASANNLPAVPATATGVASSTASGASNLLGARDSSAFSALGAMAGRLRGPLSHQLGSSAPVPAANDGPSTLTTAAPPVTTSNPDIAELRMLANAGQDAPSTLPPEVTPQTAGLAATAATLPTAAALPSALPLTTASSAPALSSAVPALPTATGPAAAANDLSGSVKLELEGVSPTVNSVKLKVVLKNGGSQTLTLPQSPTAVIRESGKPDQVATVTFTDKEVTPGAAIHGTIKVSGHSLNPAADLVLSNFLSTAFTDRDVHLTVPISFK